MFFLKWSLTLPFLNIFLKIDFYKIDGHISHKPNLATYPTNSIFKKMFYKLIISDFRLILVKKPYWNSVESNWVRLVPSFSGVQPNKFLMRPKDLFTTPSAFWPQPLRRPKPFLEEVKKYILTVISVNKVMLDYVRLC